MTIKISAFPDAAAPMATADRVTGLQGGANANFSQEQLLGSPNVAPGSASSPPQIYARAGQGDGSHSGGTWSIYGGLGGATGGGGGIALTSGYGGATSGNGGPINLTGGSATLGNGGAIRLAAGYGSGSGKNGGNILLVPGYGGATATAGNLILYNVPVAATDAGLPSGAVWINSGTRVLAVKA